MISTIVSTEWLYEHCEDQNLIILYASLKGDQDELKSLHIPGAIFFDIKNKFSDVSSSLPNTVPDPQKFEEECQLLGINNDSMIVVYDMHGIYASPRVWWLFKTMGHDNIAVLDGGLPSWIHDGFDVVPYMEKKMNTGDFVAKYKDDNVKSIDQTAVSLTNNTAVVLDARSGGRFKGTAPEPRAELSSGHMPGACSLPYTEVLKDGLFKTKEELQILFKELDLGNSPLIFSCGSGITACIILLASEIAIDNPKSVFDGSWTEWASDQKRTIIKQESE